MNEHLHLVDEAVDAAARKRGGRIVADLTDAQAVELLKLLAIYAREAAAGGIEKVGDLRVREIAGDLLESLPVELARQTDVTLDAEACQAETFWLRQ
jgi:hypothetical protein